MFDPVKEFDQLVLASAGIFNRLGSSDDRSQNRLNKITTKDTYQEKNANARKDCICCRECLKIIY
jgi:hypothetical protein